MEAEKKEGKNSVLIILIIAAVIIVILAVVIVYLIVRDNKTETASPSLSASSNATPTASASNRAGWETYNNSRFGYSIQVPPKLEKTESTNGDGASFTTWDPPMTIRVWAENNDQNLAAQQAIDLDKQSLIQEGMENFRVIVEGPIEMGGESAIESVWQYIAPPMGDAATSARAYAIKNNITYSIELLIDTSQWNSYSTIFDDVFTSFKFL